MEKNKLSEEQRALIEKELRRGTSKSRIAALLDVSYETGIELIEEVKIDVRPEIGSQITFNFRESSMTGIITKLLTNSAVVEIYWQKSDPAMKDVCEDRTIVNFKDIVSFVNLPPQEEDDSLILNPQPTIIQQKDDHEE